MKQTSIQDLHLVQNTKSEQVKDNKNLKEKNKSKSEHLSFISYYKAYFTNYQVKDEEVETHIRLIVKEALYRFRDQIVNYNIRNQVIDIINLLINYLLIVIQKSQQQQLQKDIEKIDQRLKDLKQYCFQNRYIHSCLDLYQYFDILIDLNYSRKGLDKTNQSIASRIFEKFIQLVYIGAGFVSVAGAIQSLRKINLENIKKFILEVQNIYRQMTSKPTQQLQGEIYATYFVGNLSNKICNMWFKKIEIIGEDLLSEQSEIFQIIFYIEEIINMVSKENKDIVLFVFMQLNYLLSKQKQQDNYQALTRKLKDIRKENLIQNFSSQLQLKAYSNTLIDTIKNFANYIATSEQFRYLKACLLLHFVQIIENLDIESQFYHQIMTSLCLNYLQEKEASVKIVYKGNLKMIEFIHNIENQEEIVKESKVLKERYIQLSNKEDFYKVNNDIDKLEDIPKLLAINFVQMWEVSVKQRQHNNQITHKDDILLEEINLYIKQLITYQEGYQIINSEKKNQNKLKVIDDDAVKIIIDNFLIPNYAQPLDDDNSQKQDNKFPCKILSVLAEGGSGKSILLKKLEVELLSVESDYIKDARARYIPFIIKCNQLDIKNPSIETYLASQNLKSDEIEILKKSQRNKLVMLDGFDEYNGEYFKVFKELQLREWRNTTFIVTSRLEKINISDAKNYFAYYDEQGNQGDDDSYAIVKLEKIFPKDIKNYLNLVKAQMNQDSKNNFNQSQFNSFCKIIIQNTKLIQHLQLPINLYLITRMFLDLNLDDKQTLLALQTATDQIQIFEVFFQQHFQKLSQVFVQQFNCEENMQQEIIQKVKLCHFEYFQAIAMHMFKQKDIFANFLQTTIKSVNFQLREEFVNFLVVNSIPQEKLQEHLNQYYDQRVITKIQLCFEDQNNLSNHNNSTNLENVNFSFLHQDESYEFEFRHKSIFEYFVARAMKFDFDIHQENIYSLPLKILKDFSINQKPIMCQGENKSESQILLKLYKLIHFDNTVDYKKNYNFNEIEKNNRYFQYIRKSQIDRYDQKNIIDVGSSNLLSALFASNFCFPNLVLSKCSLSTFYNFKNKHNQITFDQCNLNQALLRFIENELVESSFTCQSIFDSYNQVFSTDNIYSFNQVIFDNESIISISAQGYISQFKQGIKGQKQFNLEKTKRITNSPLYFLKICSSQYFVVSAKKTLFLIQTKDFQVHKIKQFSDSIQNLDAANSQIVVQLSSYKSYLGNLDFDFKPINIKGNKAYLSKNSEFLVTSGQNLLIIYKQIEQNFQVNQQIPFGNLDLAVFSEDNQYMATVSGKQTCNIWSLGHEIELKNTIESGKIKSLAFQPDNKYIVIGSKYDSCQVWRFQKNPKLINTLEGHSDKVTSIAFSASGQHLVACSQEKGCLIWQMKSFKLIDNISAHSKKIFQVAFSPDGKYLATCSEDNTCKIWNTLDKTFQIVQTIQIPSIVSLAFSSDSKYLATGSNGDGDDNCQIWDSAKDFKLTTSLKGHTDFVKSIAFSTNGKYLATGSFDFTIKIWNSLQNFELLITIEDHTDCVTSLAFSANNKYLATCSRDGTFKIWNTECNFKLIKSIEAQGYWFESIVLSPTFKYLITCSSDLICKIWSPSKDFKLIKEIKDQNISSITFSPSGKYLAGGTDENSCKLWDTEMGFQLVNTIQTHSNFVNPVAFSADSKYLATAWYDSSCKVWNMQKVFEIINQTEGHTQPINCVAFSGDGKYLATSSTDGNCKIWNSEQNFDLIKTIEDDNGQAIFVTFSPNCKYLATITMDSACIIWNVELNFELVQILRGHQHYLLTAAFSVDGKYLVTGSQDNTCKIWNIEKNFQLKKTVTHHTSYVTSTAFSADGKYLAVGSCDFHCSILDVKKNFELIQILEGQIGHITSVAFSPNNKYLATGSDDNTCNIWDVNQDFNLITTLEGHDKRITSVAFSNDSKYLATASQDSKCRLWNADKNFELIYIIQGHIYCITSIAFSPKCQYLATSSSDETCKIWSLENIEQLLDQTKSKKKQPLDENNHKKSHYDNEITEQLNCIYII